MPAIAILKLDIGPNVEFIHIQTFTRRRSVTRVLQTALITGRRAKGLTELLKLHEKQKAKSFDTKDSY